MSGQLLWFIRGGGGLSPISGEEGAGPQGEIPMGGRAELRQRT